MVTDFKAMSHDEIYTAVHVGAPAAVGGAATQLSDLNATISGHLDVLDKLSQSMSDAWPDENGQNFRATLSHTVGYLRELQATHITTASSSVTQVMSASHEKLSSTQSTIPTPPAVPYGQQEANLSKESKANGGIMNQGMAMQSQSIVAAKAADAKAVILAEALANTYLVEKAKLTAPPAAPKGPSGAGAGSGSPSTGSGAGSGAHSTLFAPSPTGGSSGTAPGTGSSDGTGAVGPIGGVPGHGHTAPTGAGGTGPVGTIGGDGSGHGDGGSGAGVGPIGGAGANPGGPGTLLDPTGGSGSGAGMGNGAGMGGGAGSPGGLPGTGSDSGGFGGLVPGLLGGAGAVGLGGAGMVAARKAAAARAAQQAALMAEEEEAGLGGQGGGTLTASQLAAINAQRTGVLAAGQEAGMMNSERNYMSMQQRTLSASSAAMTAEEEAAMGAGQRTVPGQLGGAPVAAGSATGARAPFSAGGVVGGAERVTWLVEDRDLWSADPGVRAVIDN